MPLPLKRKHFYVLERLYTLLAVRTLPAFARLRITPNQVTLANLLNGLLIFALIATGRFLPAALLIQLYLFLDILDGNLARYRNLSSRLGAVLDNFGDRFFYNGVMLVIGATVGNSWMWILAFLLAHNLHAAAATFLIVPAIRKNPAFRRFAFKQALMDRGYIFGMDLSSQDLLMSVLLPTSGRVWIVPVCTLLYAADLLFRLAELARNPPPPLATPENP